MAYGEFIDSGHLHARSRVAVLGSGVVDDLFPPGLYPSEVTDRLPIHYGFALERVISWTR